MGAREVVGLAALACLFGLVLGQIVADTWELWRLKQKARRR
jgi:hypothetical protein